ncbi:DUF3891 family protein [Algoriphagus chordae]|uniref:Uncharacterized protein DUF3891 n=1 Tax=Algoriphagus chordae TaxID=237019 RepID=A0A2W7RCC5_9BACT|nr:DUF3891 family protein [Algoriphagus chordae]PZX48385.1 uncharacterized protein DUF3891 [Algoriphagus chordae]
MIVSPINKGWKIIFHKAHALLAMDIGLKLDRSLWPLPKYWAAGMESIGEHDNDQPKWLERDNLTESGAPLDYRQRKEVDLEQAKAVANSAKYKSSFIVLMVAAHFQKLYGESKELKVQKFLEEMKEACDEILVNLNLEKKQVTQCYEFLRFCDDLSLALCQNDFENHKEAVQIEPIAGEEKISLSQLPNGEFLLDPWIFEEDEVVFNAECFTTTTDFYNEDAELKNDLDLLHPSEKKYLFKKRGI